VQMPRTILSKLPGDRRRVFGEDGFLIIVALPQPDAFAASKINRRPDLHGESFRQRSRRSRGWSMSIETQNIAHRTAHDKRRTP
jgi:hypothetical protein